MKDEIFSRGTRFWVGERRRRERGRRDYCTAYATHDNYKQTRAKNDRKLCPRDDGLKLKKSRIAKMLQRSRPTTNILLNEKEKKRTANGK